MECPHKRVDFAGGLGVSCEFHVPVENEAGYCRRPEYFRCIEDVNRLAFPLSYSSVSNFLTCHNLFYLRNIRGIETRNEATSSPIKMGQLWDKCLQKLLGADINLNDTVAAYEIENNDVAKVRALYRAYKTLEIAVDEGYELQATFRKPVQIYEIEADEEGSKILITGIYDRKYPTAFAENKLSGRPEMYFDIFFLQSQIGAYFIADDNLEYVDMEVVRTPALKQAKNKDEGPEDFEERIYKDIIARPSAYFLGFNNKTNRYGKRFYRSEFNLGEIRLRFQHVSREIHEACFFDGWYLNDRACNNVLPGIACDMLSVCRYGTMAENIYRIRPIPAELL